MVVESSCHLHRARMLDRLHEILDLGDRLVALNNLPRGRVRIVLLHQRHRPLLQHKRAAVRLFQETLD
jgi:hypothetical protein